MSRPELVVPVADLERGPKRAEFVLSEAWLRRALEGTEATATAPGRVDVTLSKNGSGVLIRGEISADLSMPCVVTLDPVPVPVRTELSLMLEPSAAPAAPGDELAARRRGRSRRPDAPASGSGAGQPGGRAKSVGKGEGRWEETPFLSEEMAGHDTYEGHEIALDGFVREFLILELPMFPRRSDLPTGGPAANPPLPAGSQAGGEKPLDPRLSPLAELKSRLEQKIKKE